MAMSGPVWLPRRASREERSLGEHIAYDFDYKEKVTTSLHSSTDWRSCPGSGAAYSTQHSDLTHESAWYPGYVPEGGKEAAV